MIVIHSSSEKADILKVLSWEIWSRVLRIVDRINGGVLISYWKYVIGNYAVYRLPRGLQIGYYFEFVGPVGIH